MARGVNKVILVGRIGRDPEVKYQPSGGAVCGLAVATSESWTDKNTGQKQERTEWHRVSAFGKLAEICGEYLRKGSHIYIEGSLRTRKWQAQDGTDRYTTEIIANEMQMLDSKGDQNSNGSSAPSQAQFQHAQQQYAQQQAASLASSGVAPSPYSQPVTHAQPSPFDSFDDDIPF